MRRVLTSLSVVAVVAAAGALCAPDAAAISGACKQRDSYSGPWRFNNLGFDECKAENQRRDGDNVFDERGLVWWDSRS
jgi:hypothetical protein